MIDFGLLKVLENTVISNIRDNELIEDLDIVYSVLSSQIRYHNSMDKYIEELKYDRLEWTLVHTEIFWNENWNKFEMMDFRYI